MQLLPDLDKICLSNWDQAKFRQNNLHVDVLRLDLIHPVIAGNKWFKLKYYLERARREAKSKLVSFGGAYSNHLIALANVSRMYGCSSAAYIRGEEPANLSHTLQQARDIGMELHFLSRTGYQEKKNSCLLQVNENSNRDELYIPEGGAGWEGVQGAGEILSVVPTDSYDYICCAVGTGTTLIGLANSSGRDQKIIGVSVLKGTKALEPLQMTWLSNADHAEKLFMIHDDHFGGYAKKSRILFDFMNLVYSESGIPTDFVYTGKLFYSTVRLATENFFPSGSRILVLHTGGLQGNLSLPAGLLHF
jgi:1-aminocyclopropane-1-carboxylate deaminase/D-cysteine desulfhydrase-like pyridoxal-dependent ACC family enzyme